MHFRLCRAVSVLFISVLAGLWLTHFQDKNGDSATAQVQVVLVIMVYNEAAVINRCLQHASYISDFVCACDTGSTDNTVLELRQHGVIVQVQPTLTHFGESRTRCLRSCNETVVRKLGLQPNATFALLLDADHILNVSADFDKQALRAEGYMMKQTDDDEIYQNIRLVRLDVPWHCVGVTHEYWTGGQAEPLETLQILDAADGFQRSNALMEKFLRDERMLTIGLHDEPNNERYVFYLAQTLNSLERFTEALEWYGKRIALGRWQVEVCFSQLQMARIYSERLKNPVQATYSYLQAVQCDPSLVEPLVELAALFAQRDQHELATMFASRAQNVRKQVKSPQGLFSSRSVYDYVPDYELSVASFYARSQLKTGLDALLRLLNHQDLPADVRAATAQNARHYFNRPDISDEMRQTIQAAVPAHLLHQPLPRKKLILPTIRSSHARKSLVVFPGVRGDARRAELIRVSLKAFPVDAWDCIVFSYKSEAELHLSLDAFNNCEIVRNLGGQLIDHLRLLSPEHLVRNNYETILIHLEDVYGFNSSSQLDALLNFMDSHDLDVASPYVIGAAWGVMVPGAVTVSPFRTNFIELFVTAFRLPAWLCFWYLLAPETNPQGWGYDRCFHHICEVNMGIFTEIEVIHRKHFGSTTVDQVTAAVASDELLSVLHNRSLEPFRRNCRLEEPQNLGAF